MADNSKIRHVTITNQWTIYKEHHSYNITNMIWLWERQQEVPRRSSTSTDSYWCQPPSALFGWGQQRQSKLQQVKSFYYNPQEGSGWLSVIGLLDTDDRSVSRGRSARLDCGSVTSYFRNANKVRVQSFITSQKTKNIQTFKHALRLHCMIQQTPAPRACSNKTSNMADWPISWPSKANKTT